MKKLSLFLCFLLSIKSFLFAQSITLLPNGQSEQKSTSTPFFKIKGISSPEITGIRSVSSLTNPTPLPEEYSMLKIGGQAYNGSNFTSDRIRIRFLAAENWTSTNNGTAMQFYVTKKGTNFMTNGMYLDDESKLGIGDFDYFHPVEHKLHVKGGDFKVEDTTPFMFLKTTGASGTGNAGITFQNSLNQAKAIINYNHVDDYLRLVNGSSTTDGVFVTKTVSNINQIGIGTNTPEGKLHLKANGSGTVPQLVIEENNNSDFGRINFSNFSSPELWTLAGKTDGVIANAQFNIYNTHFGNVATFYGSGNTRLAGFSQLGSSAPSIKMKKISGVTDVASVTPVAHGLTRDKIIAVDIHITNGLGVNYPPSGNGLGPVDRQYRYYINSANIMLDDVASALRGQNYWILITYEE